HPARVVTSAGTGTASLALATGGLVTEIQPGSYALMDASYRAAGATFEQAVHVVTAIRSVTRPGTAIVDAGLKAVSVDMGPAQVADLDAAYAPAGDEHGVIEGDLGGRGPGAHGHDDPPAPRAAPRRRGRAAALLARRGPGPQDDLRLGVRRAEPDPQ